MAETLSRGYQLVERVSAEVVEDLGRWPIQAVLIVSLVGCLAGVMAFRGNPASCEKERKSARYRAILYWASLLPSIAWYVLPFLHQARFRSLADGVASGDRLFVAVGSIGAAVAIWNCVAAMRVVTVNRKATGPAMVDFLQPACLLDAGPYARVRHPMFVHDFLTHAGLTVAVGALTTVVLLPLYFVFSAIFNVVEEKWVLQPRFQAAFDIYRRKTPGYMTRSGLIVIAVLGTAVAVLVASWDTFHQ